MKIINQNLLDKTHDFFRKISQKDKVAIIHHTDPDGVSSGVIVSKAIEKIRNKKIDLRLNQNSSELYISQKTLEKLHNEKINKVIITDMGVDQDVIENKVELIEDFAEILIIDHHKIYRDLNSDKTTLIKPDMVFENVNSAQYCAAKFCYDLVTMILPINELDWVACLGIIGDCGYETWKSFVDEVFKKYNIESKGDAFDTDLGMIAEIISSTEAFDIKKIEDAFNILYNATTYKDVLHSELRKYKEDIEKEIKHWRLGLNQFAEVIDELDLIYYELIDPNYPVKSNLCTLLSFDYPNKSIVVLQEFKDQDMITVSARRRDNKVKMNDLLEFATKGLSSAGGGGHIPAAGGRFLKKDKEEFKRRVVEWLKNI